MHPAEPAHGEAERGLTPAERRLAASRAELESLLAPDPGEFPRSETMRFLTGGRGKMVMLGVFAGLLVVRPRFALGLVRFLPLGRLLPMARLLLALR